MKRIFASLAITTLTLFMPMALVAPTYAACSNDAEGQVLQGFSDCTNDGSTKVNSLLSSIITILSAAIGIAAVIMIIIAGLKFVTAGGESNAVASAKSTLIYALVGLAIAALAQVLVHFVIGRVKS